MPALNKLRSPHLSRDLRESLVYPLVTTHARSIFCALGTCLQTDACMPQCATLVEL